MSQDELNKIKQFFAENNIEVTYLEHEAVTTSEEAAKSRGVELKQGIKALLFTDTNNNWVIVDVPADKRVDTKKICEELNWSKNKIRMATPIEVIEYTGCEIGSVPPFGHKEQIKILVDQNIYENKESLFNIGLKTHSVKLNTASMKIVFEKVNAKEGIFAK